VKHLNCGTMCPRGARLLAGHGGLLEPTEIVAHCLLIEAGGELVLVDTGFGLGDCSNPNRLGRPFRALVRPRCAEGETAIRQIEALGHNPADVRHILITHLDLDHAGGIGDFPDAKIHLFGAELAVAQHPPLRERARYVRSQWGPDPDWTTYEAGGDDWFGFESVRLLPDLDAEIALIPLPGHTAGHSGVAINTPDGWLLHCGDSFFFAGEIETPPHSTPGLRFFQTIDQHDGEARHRNQERLRELRREHGDEVTLFCSHDAQMLEAAQRQPAAA
jgi:glyoxylase-like metal-dependent hydrolase (beta-lactamase superfamily II)